MADIDCLKACAECSRHVRCGERTCPFCGAAVTVFMRAPEYRLKTRLGRGATFSLGAALGAVGFVLACEADRTQALYGAPCNPPSCTFPSNGGAGASGGVAGGGAGGINTANGGVAGGLAAGGGVASRGAGGNDEGGRAGAVSEGGVAGAEEPGEGGAAGK
jgi:hypothetical protein